MYKPKKPSLSEKAEILIFIRERPKCTVLEISEGLHLQMELVCTVLDALEQKGLITASKLCETPEYRLTEPLKGW